MAALTENKHDQKELRAFDLSMLQKQPDLPTEFTWPPEDLPNPNPEALDAPLIDLEGFLKGDEKATLEAVELIRTACENHGFFLVSNHGVDESLIRAAEVEMDAIFKMSLEKKLSLPRKRGSVVGYSGSHAHRFASKLPWKEAFSFLYHENSSDPVVVEYFKSALGQDFERIGWVYQKYSEEMNRVAGVIFELLAVSLGLEDRLHYKKFFEDGTSIMRCNSYPPCNNAGLALGTGPHYDPTSITILYQDEVGGLEVFADNKWQAVTPRKGSFVVNIGDTFMALTNGRYKSCLHRAVVNTEKERKSLVYFVSVKEDKVIKPPQELVDRDGSRMYPDFKWLELFEFTQYHHRVDNCTFESFVNWILSSKKAT